MRDGLVIPVALALSMAISSTSSAQESAATTPKVYGYFQFIGLIMEESQNNLKGSTGGPAADSASGFQERRARVGAKGRLASGQVGFNLLTEWAGSSPAAVDFWASGHLAEDTLELRFGRFKPHLSAEMFMSGADLPNIERSLPGKLIAAYMFPIGSTRDLGLMAKYALPQRLGHLYLSATNGLGNGPTAQVGGVVINRRNIRSKNAGDGLLCVGLAFQPGEGWTISLSGAMNKITAAVAADDMTLDINRSSYAAGFKYEPSAPVWVDAEYTSASRGEADMSGKDEMRGYFARAGVWIIEKKLDLILRRSAMEQGAGGRVKDSDYGAAVRYRFNELEMVAEYIKTDGSEGSVYGTKDPSALAVRLGVKF